ncbi:hypothetical protein [Capnocytophaga gingivalis]|uniref:Uncharacterized protein n=1 Tax=Capnocytophaga gingivalis TaxID=1017 RepID=A0ABU5ZBS1_9FLAO|nr:hypothetical protein [Capnocytophaga gingivalis]MEB3075773.1 hypothetical protein [Capnocytophaga gingivalis]
MEEALEILWTYARRQPIESNGKTVVATISQSIAAIRLIMRLEGRFQKSGERKVNSGKLATPINITHDCPASTPAQPQFTQSKIDTPAPLVSSSLWEEKAKSSQQEPNHPIIKPSYHTTKPRKVCRQHSCVKNDDRSSKQMTKTRKFSRQYSYIIDNLYKDIALIELPMNRDHVANRYDKDSIRLKISSRPPPSTLEIQFIVV